jgi:hypothetical protein
VITVPPAALGVHGLVTLTHLMVQWSGLRNPKMKQRGSLLVAIREKRNTLVIEMVKITFLSTVR